MAATWLFRDHLPSLLFVADCRPKSTRHDDPYVPDPTGTSFFLFEFLRSCETFPIHADGDDWVPTICNDPAVPSPVLRRQPELRDRAPTDCAGSRGSDDRAIAYLDLHGRQTRASPIPSRIQAAGEPSAQQWSLLPRRRAGLRPVIPRLPVLGNNGNDGPGPDLPLVSLLPSPRSLRTLINPTAADALLQEPPTAEVP